MKRRGSAVRIVVAALAACAAFALFPAAAFAAISEDTTEGIKDGKLAINEANFPDKNFREYISEKFDAKSSTITVTVNGEDKSFTFTADTADDGYLTSAELERITHIYCGDRQIKSLQGIEYFTKLAWLNCDNNGLGEEMNFLNDPDLQKQWAKTLRGLQCAGNQITDLDLRAYSKLETLGCIGKNSSKLKTLIVNPGIQKIYCWDNDLQELNVSKCTQLAELNCDNNKNLGSLDVSNCPELLYLFCANTGLTQLDVRKNVKLETLRCNYNDLKTLDVTKNTALKRLFCTKIGITSLDLTQNPALEKLNVSDNQLTSLSLIDGQLNGEQLPGDEEPQFTYSNNTYQIAVGTDCKFNLKTLPGFDAEKVISCTGGSVDAQTGILTVEKDAEKVTYIYNCGAGKRAAFTLLVHHHDFSGWVEVDKNQHKHVCKDDKSEEFANHTYEPGGSTCTGCGYESDHHWVWDRDETSHRLKCIDAGCTETTNEGPHDLILEMGKGKPDKLECVCGYTLVGVAINETNFPDKNFRKFVSESFDKDSNAFITSTKLAEITKIDCNNQGIRSLKGIEYFTALTELNCNDNNLAENGLDVSALENLEVLHALRCQLTELDLSKNTKLKDLGADGNQLTKLDLSSCKSMKYLWVQRNQLTELDLTDLDDLEDVGVNTNKLTVLDLSDKMKLNKVGISENRLTSLTIGGTVGGNGTLALWQRTGNQYEITPDSQRRFNLKNLPGDFDIDKVTAGSWSGGVVDEDGILTVEEGKNEVTYAYDCGVNGDATFTLKVVVHKHIYAEDDWQLDAADPTKHSHKCTDPDCPDEDKGIVREPHEYGTDGKCICGAEHDPHTYGAWTKANENQHKRTCTVDGVEEYEEHHFTGDVCDDCGYKRGHVHDYGTEWKKDETGHWHECTANDGGKTAVEPHVYDNDADTTCNTCGYERTLPGPDPVDPDPIKPDPVDPDPVDPVEPDYTLRDEFGGAMSAVIVGGTAVWGAYETGTGIYRMLNMRGIPMPSDRIGLAVLVWEKAGKPEPESTALYTDIEAADLNAQKAARWVVEQGLLLDDGEQFHPDGFVGKLRVCFAWDEAKQKGFVA